MYDGMHSHGALPLPPPPSPPVHAVAPQQVPLQELPRVLTLMRHDYGWASVDGEALISAKGNIAPPVPAQTVEQAFGQDQQDDRHFTCYSFQDRRTGIGYESGIRLTQSGYALMQDVLKHPGQFSPGVEALCQTLEPVGNLLAIDYDLPDHGAWTPELIEQVHAALAQAGATNPLIAQPSIAYMTRGGFRLVWLLSVPIPIEGRRGLVDLLPGLVASMHVANIHVDPSCKDWTRIFRLPRVMRDVMEHGKVVARPTSRESYLRQSWGCVDFTRSDASPPTGSVVMWPEAAFKGISEFTQHGLVASNCQALLTQYRHLVGVVPQMGSRASMIALGDQPGDDIVGQLMGGDGKDSMVEVSQVRDWIKQAVKVTQKRPEPPACASAAFNYLLAEKPLIDTLHPNEPGQLHTGITTAAMAIMRTLRLRLRHESARPQVLYAMLLQSARRSNAMRSRPRSDAELSGEVWSVIGWAYRTEVGVLEDLQEQEDQERVAETQAAQVQTHNTGAQQQLLMQAVGRMIAKGPLADPLDPPSPEQYDWLTRSWKQHLIMSIPKVGYSVLTMQPNGRIDYCKPQEGFVALGILIRNSGHDHITTTTTGASPGKEIARTEHEILHDYGSMVDRFALSRIIPANEVKISFYEGKPEITYTQALQGMDMSIPPRFDPEVHAWLTALGGDQSESLFDWLASIWDLSRPATMLHIEGKSDIGKSLIIKGIKNCTAAKQWTNISDMFGEFQDLALHSPLLVGDEEYGAVGKAGSRSVLNVLKKLATGEANTINMKGRAAIQIQGNWRVIMVENGTRMLQFTEDMSAKDQKALMSRLLLVKADAEECRRIVDRVDGRKGVEEWLAYKLPQHIRYLGVERKLDTSARVLAFSRDDKAQATLQIASNTMLKVLNALGSMLVNKQSQQQGLYWLKGRDMVVRIRNVKSVMKALLDEDGQQMPSERSIDEALRTLTEQEEQKTVRGVGGFTEKAWRVPLKELVTRLLGHTDHVDFKAALGEELWTELVPAKDRLAYDNAEDMPSARAVAKGAAGSKSLGDQMREAATKVQHTNGQHAPAPPMPSVMGMSSGSLFSSVGLPPLPPSALPPPRP